MVNKRKRLKNCVIDAVRKKRQSPERALKECKAKIRRES